MSEFITFPSTISLPASPVISNTISSNSKYEQIIRAAFFAKFREGARQFEISRDEIDGSALGLDPKNIGDIIYSYRYRRELPTDIQECAPPGMTWIIVGAGAALYRFTAVREAWYEPNKNMKPVVLPDHTPYEVLDYGERRDEQAILASIQQNRLLDFFLGCRLERKQSHWRTKVEGIGQIEIDDVYVGNERRTGNKVVVTVQAKRDKDRISSVQIIQDIFACRAKADGKICRPVAVHYDSATERLACMEFAEDDLDHIKLVDEQHYILQRTF